VGVGFFRNGGERERMGRRFSQRGGGAGKTKVESRVKGSLRRGVVTEIGKGNFIFCPTLLGTSMNCPSLL
jgi:hypothetical protein